MAQSGQIPRKAVESGGELAKKQVSIWLAEVDARFLRQIARERNQSVSGVIRSAIAAWRRKRDPYS